MGNDVVEVFLGKEVRESNKVCLKFGADEFKKLIAQSDSLNISVANLIQIQRTPCQNCGDDYVVIKKLTSQTSNKYRKASKPQLYIFVNSNSNNRNLKLCELSIEYSLACKIGVNKLESVLTDSNNRSTYNGGDCDNVILNIIKNDSLWLTIMCNINNNVINSI